MANFCYNFWIKKTNQKQNTMAEDKKSPTPGTARDSKMDIRQADMKASSMGSSAKPDAAMNAHTPGEASATISITPALSKPSTATVSGQGASQLPGASKPVAPQAAKPASGTAPVLVTPKLTVQDSKASGSNSLNIFTAGKGPEKKESKMMQSILKQKSPAGLMQKSKSILGQPQELKAAIEAERGLAQKRKYRFIQFLFVLVLLSALTANGFLFSQITLGFDIFGANLMSNLDKVNKNLISQQTQLNKFRYLSAQLDLNSFSYASDEYWDLISKLNDNNMTAAQITSASARINELIEELPRLLTSLKGHLGEKFIVDTYDIEGTADPNSISQMFVSQLKELLNDDKKQIEKAGGTDAEIKLVQNAAFLAGNSKVVNAVKSADSEEFKNRLRAYSQDSSDAELRSALETTMGNILATTKSEIAVISTLKKERIEWSKIIKRLETVSKDLEIGRGQDAKINMDPQLFEIRPASLFYSGYQLDADANAISLSGVISTADATNFYLISRLMDILEEDPYFMNIDLRTFSKAGRQGEGYSSNFSFTVDLDLKAIEENERKISLIKRILAIKEGKKRN